MTKKREYFIILFWTNSINSILNFKRICKRIDGQITGVRQNTSMPELKLILKSSMVLDLDFRGGEVTLVTQKT